MRYLSNYRLIGKTLVVLLVLATVDTYVGLSAPKLHSDENTAVRNNSMTAILTIGGTEAATVNGFPALSGTTILTGSQIQSPEIGDTTIAISSIGYINLAPRTSLKLEFDGSAPAKVTLNSGCVRVSSNAVTSAIDVFTPKGFAVTAAGDSMNVCQPSSDAAPTIEPVNKATPNLNDKGSATSGPSATDPALIAGEIGYAGLITATLVIPCRRGRNPSPGVPRGRNDCH
ncbi:MAG TPA: hypothetical protein VLE19_06395 [Pyrinomonadaceae bacterium]|nr:hypothetical protein [Pyrinomonadaceae bacterium]